MVAEAAEFKMSREKRRGGKKDKVKEWYGEEKKGAWNTRTWQKNCKSEWVCEIVQFQDT